MSEQWSYFTVVLKNAGVHELDDQLNLLGADGWELVASLSTVKTWVNLTGNDLVLVFKKPGAGERPSPETLAALRATPGDPW